jgi:hypothetical protein
MKYLLAVLALMAAATTTPALGQQPTDPVGRLFFSPEQRDGLDARRRARVPDRPAETTVASPTTRFDGHVQRANGRSTVWLNGVPMPAGARSEQLSVATRPGEPAQATVTPADTGRAARLKVGETLDVGSGEVRRPDARITVQRGAVAR